jgi:arylsulfatase A-like enzyme
MIMADDIGFWNISAYNRGMMGYRTPNIDRIANEGAVFTDYHGQQSGAATMLFNLRFDPFERTSFDRKAKG